MRKYYLKVSLLLLSVLLTSNLSFSQGDASPAKKGNVIVSGGQNISLSSASTRLDGTKIENNNNTDMFLESTYFFLEGQGISAQLDYSRNNFESLSTYATDQLYRQKILFLGYTYAYEYNKSITFYGKAMLGLGAARDRNIRRYTNPAITQDFTAMQTGILLTLGAYIQLLNNPLWLITPTISYKRTNANWDTHNTISSNLLFQASIVASLSYQSLYCKSGNSQANNIADRYLAGTLFTLTTLANPFLNFGSTNIKNDNGSSTKNNLSGAGINLGAGYYLADLFAISLALDLYSNQQKHETNTLKFNNTLLTLEALHHLPMDGYLRNFYGFVLVKIGRSGSTDTYTSDNVIENPTTETLSRIINKASQATIDTEKSFLNTGFGLGIGYNYPIADIVSVFGKLQYVVSNLKDIDTELKKTFRDKEFALGLRIDLN